MGVLSLFGAVGAAADYSGRKSERATTIDLMQEFLSDEAQVAELTSADVATALGLPGYRLVVETSIPSKSAAKSDAALGQRREALRSAMKGSGRLSQSTAPCYAELVGGRIFYIKTPLYGANLFTGWTLREFGRDGMGKPVVRKGEVKNPISNFPPKTAEGMDAAKAGLRESYRKNFLEWLQKKRRPATAETAR